MVRPLLLILAMAGPDWAQTPAADWQRAYMFAYPMVLLDASKGTGNTLDLSKQPALLRIPAASDGEGFFLLQIFDAWGESVAVESSRTAAREGGWIAVAGPAWKGKLPSKVTRRIDVATNLAWIFRRDSGSLAKAAEAVARMDGAAFFARFDQLRARNPAHPEDAAMVELLRKLGPFQSESKEGVDAAKALLAAVEELRATMAGTSGWTGVNSSAGRFGVNYLARAIAARTGTLADATPPRDAVALSCHKDPSGRPLEGAYRMHLDKGAMPPARAAWSITVYDADGVFARIPGGGLHAGPDGSLDFKLPAPPAGRRFHLVFRLFWPKEEVLNGSWTPPPVLRARE